ncbi:MAG TPA: extracellular solute-binding protein [Anaerolineae bacterium]
MKARSVTLCLLCLITFSTVACERQPVVGTRTPLDTSRFYLEPTAEILPTPTESDKTVVEFWTDDNEPERVAVYEEVANRFMASHPNVDLRIVPVDESSISERITAAVAADALPDILRLGIERVMSLAADDLLDDEAAQVVIESVGQADFREAPLNLVANPNTGRPMAVPYEGWIQALWYRTDALAELDLSLPISWDAIGTAACALPDSGYFEHGIVLPTDPGQNYVHQVFEQVAISNNAWPFDQAGNVTMNTPEMIEALTWYGGLQECALPGVQSADGARTGYLANRAGMFFYSTYIMDDLVEGIDIEGAETAEGDLARKTGFTALMSGPNGAATYGQLVALAITGGADPAAQDVATFFLTEGYLDVLAIEPFGKVPVLKSAVDEWKQSSEYFNYYSEETLERIVNSHNTVQRWFFRPDYDVHERAVIGEIEGQLLIPQVIYTMVIERTLTPRAGAEFLQTRVEALLAERIDVKGRE